VSVAPAACILGCTGPRLSRAESAFFAGAGPWGFILFGRNVETPAQLRALTSDLRDAVGRNAPILIDQEGGRVQRLGPPHWSGWLPPLDQVAAAGDPARALWLRYAIIGAELRAVGIDVNCVPACDIAGDATHPFLRNRCLGTDPATVARLARAVADGCLAGGALPVVKHLPGHGRAAADSHHALPVVDAARPVIEAEAAPFRALADLPLGMTAHVVYPALDTVPATVSAPAIQWIRESIGFAGLLMTDDISMAALGGPLADRAALARAAGCDVVLHCSGDLTEMAAVVEASGALDLAVAARAEAWRRNPETDVAAWRAGFDAAMAAAA
jgi:beta-N-acetylhexosaminidase